MVQCLFSSFDCVMAMAVKRKEFLLSVCVGVCVGACAGVAPKAGAVVTSVLFKVLALTLLLASLSGHVLLNVCASSFF